MGKKTRMLDCGQDGRIFPSRYKHYGAGNKERALSAAIWTRSRSAELVMRKGKADGGAAIGVIGSRFKAVVFTTGSSWLADKGAGKQGTPQ